MKKVIMLAVLIIAAALLQRPAQAGVFGTASTLRSGHFSLGLEPSLAFSPAEFLFFFHGGLGLTRSIDLDAKLGLGSYIYFGADVEFKLIPDSRYGPGLSLSAGAHGTSNFGLDATLNLSNRFRTFSFYAALDADIEILESENSEDTLLLVPFYFDLGVAIPLSRQSEFLFECNIALSEPANSGLSAGLAFYF
ncbi:hypothetical protein KAR10_00030 [bacterium]|nr:hypothetical protein [bacterium]